MKKFLFSFILSFPIFALPRFAAENGTSCNLCHVNPAGAGLRNDYGISLFSMEELPMEKGMKFTDEDYTGMILENLRFGADLRFQVLSHTDDQEESRTAYVPMQSDLYGNLSVSKGVEVFVKQDVLRQQPEFWTTLPILPNDGYLRIGKFIPTYGLRLDDHTAFTRGGNISFKQDPEKKEGMLFSPYSVTPGIIEAGIYFSDIFLTLSTADKFANLNVSGASLKDKNLTFRGEYTGSIGSVTTLLGGSLMKEGDLQLSGLFGGASFHGLTWTGEVDIAENWAGDDITSLASFSEFSYSVMQGLHFVARYDLWDEDTKIKNNAIYRLTVGTDIFPISFFEIKLQGRFTSLSGNGKKPKPVYIMQFHTWF